MGLKGFSVMNMTTSLQRIDKATFFRLPSGATASCSRRTSILPYGGDTHLTGKSQAGGSCHVWPALPTYSMPADVAL
jgi:hypothetical protein